MIYPYMTLPDETEITHSEILTNNGREQVKIYIETPVEGGFKDATCILPDYKWENHGYSEEEMKYYKDFVEKAAHLFFKFARGGGFENAANFQHRLIILDIIENRAFEIVDKGRERFGVVSFYC